MIIYFIGKEYKNSLPLAISTTKRRRFDV